MKEIQKKFYEIQEEMKEVIEGTRTSLIRKKGNQILFGDQETMTRVTFYIPTKESEAFVADVDIYNVWRTVYFNDDAKNREVFKFGKTFGGEFSIGINNQDEKNSKIYNVTITPYYKEGRLEQLDLYSTTREEIYLRNTPNSKKEELVNYDMETIVNDESCETLKHVCKEFSYLRVDVYFCNSKMPPIIQINGSYSNEHPDREAKYALYFWETDAMFCSYDCKFEVARVVNEVTHTKDLVLEDLSASVDEKIAQSTINKEIVSFTDDGFLNMYHRPSDTLTAKCIPVPNVYYDKSFDIVYTMENENGESVEIDRVQYRSNKNFEYCVGRYYGTTRKLNDDGTIKKYAHFRPFEVIEVTVNNGEQQPYMYSNAVLELAEFEKEEWCIITIKDKDYIGEVTDNEDDKLMRTLVYELNLDVPTETGNYIKVIDSQLTRTVEMHIGKMLYIDATSKTDTSSVSSFITAGINYTQSHIGCDADGMSSSVYIDNDVEAKLRNNRIVELECRLGDEKLDYIYTRDYFGIPCTKHIWFDAPDKE